MKYRDCPLIIKLIFVFAHFRIRVDNIAVYYIVTPISEEDGYEYIVLPRELHHLVEHYWVELGD